MTTALTQHAGIRVPLICGAMYPCSNPELVGAGRVAFDGVDGRAIGFVFGGGARTLEAFRKP